MPLGRLKSPLSWLLILDRLAELTGPYFLFSGVLFIF